MRSKALVFLLISSFFVKLAQSQTNELLIQGQTGNLYLEHTVVAKENWYSLGRLYNISPKEIAPFNKLTMAQPLTIGQPLQIPLTAANFSQNGVKVPAETLVPLYHVIQEKEWMYRISVNYNKVPIANLEKWNNINKDQVKAGMHLIVGYLKVKTALSALAAGGGGGMVAAAPGGSGAATDGSLPKGVAPAATSTTGATVTTAAAATPKTGAGSKAATPAASRPPVITATVAPPAPPKEISSKGVATTGETGAVTGAATGATVKEEPKPADPKPVVHTNPPAATAGTPAIHFNGGYFKNDFTDGGKSTTGPAGIFKSTSGWQDGKYYALMNNVPVGTIVKINVPSTGKSVYAKILGQLPDMKESGGLTVRISNAAASELGEGEAKFMVEVRY